MRRTNNERDPNKEIQPVVEVSPVPSDKNQIVRDADNQSEPPKAEHDEYDDPPQEWEDPSKPKVKLNKAEWIAVATLLVIVAQNFLLYYTLEEMKEATRAAQMEAMATRDQLPLIRDSVNVAKDSADAAQKQANASLTQANVSERMAKQNESLIKSAQIQANTSQVSARAAESSAKFAEDSVRATKDAAFISSRGYLSVREIYPPELNMDRTSIIKLDWDNDGNSPARIIGGKVVLMVTRNTSPPKFTQCLANARGQTDAVLVQPHATRTQRFFWDQGSLTQDQITAVYNGSGILTFCGEFSYETLGRTFPLRFCGYWDNEAKTYINCKGDDQKPN